MWANACVDIDKKAEHPEGRMKRETGRLLRFLAPSHSWASMHLTEDQGQGAKTLNATRVLLMSEQGQE